MSSDSLPEWHPVSDNFAANWLTNGAPLHPLTVNLVVRFARALAAKLAAAEQKYGYSDGWRDAGWMDECRVKLIEHIAKGDPRDVAAYCAFLWHHGESTAVHPEERADSAVPSGHVSETDCQIFPVAQRPEASKVPCTSPADARVAPQERQVSNLRQSSASSTDAACVLASAPGESILREALARLLRVAETVRVFVTSREQINKPTGAEWFDAEIEAARSALAGTPPKDSGDESGAHLGAVQRPRGTTER